LAADQLSAIEAGFEDPENQSLTECQGLHGEMPPRWTPPYAASQWPAVCTTWPLVGAVALLSTCGSNEIVYKYRSAIFKHLSSLVR